MSSAKVISNVYEAISHLSAGAYLGILFLSILALGSYRLFLHPLSAVPGPKLWALTRIPYIWALWRGNLGSRLKILHCEYGSVVRIAPNEVSFCDQRAWNAFYAYRHGGALPKNRYWHRERVENGTTGIMSSSNSDHGRFRRAIAPALTDKAVRDCEPLLLRHINSLMRQLGEEKGKSFSTNLIDWFEYTAFDIIGDLTLSKSFHTLENDEYHDLVNAFRKFLTAFTIAVIPRILNVDLLYRRLMPSFGRKKQVAYNKSLSFLTRERIENGSEPGRQDVVAHLMREQKAKSLSVAESENAIGDVVIAGSETVSTTLAAICYQLLRTPQAYERLKSKIRGQFNVDDDINIEGVSKIPLLDAVHKEAMRLCPSIPMVLPRTMTEPGMEACGYWLPAGTSVSFCQLAAYHDAANFGSPQEFLPERWLPNSNIEPHNEGIYHPFGIGPRDCIGRLFALAEVRLIIAKLLWNFDMQLAEEQWDWNSQRMFFAWEKRPLQVKLTRVSS